MILARKVHPSEADHFTSFRELGEPQYAESQSL